jgi:hypothetical protein
MAAKFAIATVEAMHAKSLSIFLKCKRNIEYLGAYISINGSVVD